MSRGDPQSTRPLARVGNEPGASTAAGALLSVTGLEAGHGRLQALWAVDLEVAAGECVVILGANGAGKSTLLRALLGLLAPWRSQLRFDGREISALPTEKRVALGIAFMSETGVFPDLTVQENLLLGGYRLPARRARANLARAWERFPALAEHRRRRADSLSGGQRKLLGIAKVLMGEPRLIVMDEPSAGLSPKAVREVMASLRPLRERDTALLIAEQNVAFLELADRTVVLEGGRVSFDGTVAELQSDERLRRAYFGLEG